MVKNELSETTVLCIAHRLHTIAFYDLVLVMNEGSVAELASPYQLISDPNSIFHAMCQSSGSFQELLDTSRSCEEKRTNQQLVAP